MPSIVLLILCDAPLVADSADEVTLDRPSDAFDVIFDAVSFDLAAVSFAASVVEACRLEVWRTAKRVGRRISRIGVVVDITKARSKERLYEVVIKH